MRITRELILQCHQFINPLNERQLDLKGYKIALIENLGTTLDFFDCIDLSDNEITRLQNFTLMKRLKTLVLANNKISKISSLGETLPNLETLVLSNNRISEIEDFDALSSSTNLKRIFLLNNPVTKIENYRAKLVAKIPSLKIIDFEKVSQEVIRLKKERKMFQPSSKADEELIPLTRKEKIRVFVCYSACN